MNPFTENELYRFSKLAEPKSGEDFNYEDKLKQLRKNKEKEIDKKISTLRDDMHKNRDLLTMRKGEFNFSDNQEGIAELEKAKKIEESILMWSTGGETLDKNKKKKPTKDKKN
jgi:hypothetical protein